MLNKLWLVLNFLKDKRNLQAEDAPNEENLQKLFDTLNWIFAEASRVGNVVAHQILYLIKGAEHLVLIGLIVNMAQIQTQQIA